MARLLHHRARREHRVADAPHRGHRAGAQLRAFHDRGVHLDLAVAVERGAAPGVEQRVVLQHHDRRGDRIEAERCLQTLPAASSACSSAARGLAPACRAITPAPPWMAMTGFSLHRAGAWHRAWRRARCDRAIPRASARQAARASPRGSNLERGRIAHSATRARCQLAAGRAPGSGDSRDRRSRHELLRRGRLADERRRRRPVERTPTRASRQPGAISAR